MLSAAFEALCPTQELFDQIPCLLFWYSIRCGQARSNLWTDTGNEHLGICWTLGAICYISSATRRYSHIERRICIESIQNFGMRLEGDKHRFG
jgi:hypothetical protein